MSLQGRLYDLFLAPWERLGFARRRRKLLRGLRGPVLELGVGTGLNLPEYPGGLTIVAVDPNLQFLRRSRRRRRERQHLVCARAEALPFAAETFATAIGTLVFCTVEAPERGLRETRRVMREGGELRLIEHVRWARRPLLARLQDWLTPAWKLVSDGCHLNRATEHLVSQAGFEITRRKDEVGGLLVELHAAKSSTAGGGPGPAPS